MNSSGEKQRSINEMEAGHFEMILLPKRIPTPIIPQSTWRQKTFIGKQRVEFYEEYIENLGGFICCQQIHPLRMHKVVKCSTSNRHILYFSQSYVLRAVPLLSGVLYFQDTEPYNLRYK